MFSGDSQRLALPQDGGGWEHAGINPLPVIRKGGERSQLPAARRDQHRSAHRFQEGDGSLHIRNAVNRFLRLRLCLQLLPAKAAHQAYPGVPAGLPYVLRDLPGIGMGGIYDEPDAVA